VLPVSRTLQLLKMIAEQNWRGGVPCLGRVMVEDEVDAVGTLRS
jgi:hypothetical protein